MLGSAKKRKRDEWRFWWRVENNENRDNFLTMIQKTPVLVSPCTLPRAPWLGVMEAVYMYVRLGISEHWHVIWAWWGEVWKPSSLPLWPRWRPWSSVQAWRERWTGSCRGSWPTGSAVSRAWRSYCTMWASCGPSWPAQVGVPSRESHVCLPRGPGGPTAAWWQSSGRMVVRAWVTWVLRPLQQGQWKSLSYFRKPNRNC